VLSVQWRVWVWSVLVLSAYRVWGLGRAPQTAAGEATVALRGCPVPPLGRWWAGGQRWSFGQLWQAVRQEIWEIHAFPQEVRRIVAKVGENALWAPAVEAPVLGARRG